MFGTFWKIWICINIRISQEISSKELYRLFNRYFLMMPSCDNKVAKVELRQITTHSFSVVEKNSTFFQKTFLAPFGTIL